MSSLSLQLALLSAALLGFRHGLDYDHVAAISDIASTEKERRRALYMGFLYALGHMVMVAGLGITVVIFQSTLPTWIDRWTERAVGLTLFLLGLYVLGSIRRGDSRQRSRWLLLADAFGWIAWKLKRALGSGVLVKPPVPSWNFTRKSSFFIGVIHGFGAETPSQLALFLLAANLGGTRNGILGLAMFLGGLLAMNTLITAAAIGIFGISAPKPFLLRTVSVLTALYSITVGLIFFFGLAKTLPVFGS